MALLYVREQGAYIRRSGERVAVTKEDQKLLEYPLSNLEGIVLMGNVQMTTQLIHLLLNRGIDVTYLSMNGKYIGKLASQTSKNIFLRFAQYDTYNNIGQRTAIAKAIVANKISNQINVISKYDWRESDYDWREDVNRIKECLQKLPEKNTNNEIMGIEGISSQIYFGAYGAIFKGTFTFEKRNRRPPRDPVNALISLGYTFLTKDIDSVLESQSFETYLGFLHGIRYGRKSLALDNIEEFRQPVIDRMVLYMVNKGTIKEDDFEEDKDSGITLSEDGFKKFCKTYEKYMNAPVDKNTQSYMNIIKSQVNELRYSIMNGQIYNPYRYNI